MDETIFHKIIKREVPADIIYEDENVLSFLDISPDSQGHTLVIPKKESVNVFDADSEDLKNIISVVKTLSLKIKNGLGADSVRIVCNSGKNAGQIVFYTHFHIVPFYESKPEVLETSEIVRLLKNEEI